MTRRTAKVEELLREELSKLIQANIPENLGIISVTRTIVTPDLKTAKIFVSAMMLDKELAILNALKQKTNFFQGVLGKKSNLRYTPKLSFEFDRANGEIDKVEQLLEEIKRGS